MSAENMRFDGDVRTPLSAEAIEGLNKMLVDLKEKELINAPSNLHNVDAAITKATKARTFNQATRGRRVNP